MTVRIQSLATATPPNALTQDDALALAVRLTGATGNREAALGRVYGSSGVDSRQIAFLEDDGSNNLYLRDDAPHNPGTAERMARYLPAALEMSARACLEAIVGASLSAPQITHIVTVSCTGFAAPGLDLSLMTALGLSPDVQRTHVGFMGCHGAINGLRVASALAAQPGARVLLCCVEVCSLHFNYAKSQGSAVANALFGDGAAACIISAEPANNPQLDLTIQSTSSRVFANTEDAMSWSIGDHGFAMTLSPRVPGMITDGVSRWLGDWLAQHSLSIQQIAHWAIHPGGPRVVESVAEALALNDSAAWASRKVLAELGNMSSPTVLFILQRILEIRENTDAVGAKGTIALLAFGPGLTAEGVLVR